MAEELIECIGMNIKDAIKKPYDSFKLLVKNNREYHERVKIYEKLNSVSPTLSYFFKILNLNESFNRPIYNCETGHALFTFHELLDLANKEKYSVRIVSSRFNSEFYGKLENDIDKCLNNGSEVSVICTSYDMDLTGNKFVDTIKTHKNGYFRQVKDNNLSIPHFILVGDKSYRLETDHLQAKAIINFNDDIWGNFLRERFEENYNRI